MTHRDEAIYARSDARAGRQLTDDDRTLIHFALEYAERRAELGMTDRMALRALAKRFEASASTTSSP